MWLSQTPSKGILFLKESGRHHFPNTLLAYLLLASWSFPPYCSSMTMGAAGSRSTILCAQNIWSCLSKEKGSHTCAADCRLIFVSEITQEYVAQIQPHLTEATGDCCRGGPKPAATAEGTEREGSHCSSFQQQVAVSQPHTALKFFIGLFLLYQNCHREYSAHTSGKRCDGGR